LELPSLLGCSELTQRYLLEHEGFREECRTPIPRERFEISEHSQKPLSDSTSTQTEELGY